MKTYCVYKHTNNINGKCYIGITSQQPNKRWLNGYGYSKTQPKFYNAIKKYGWDNFTHEILFENLTLEEANQKEIELISLYNTREAGYNTSTGGNGNPGHEVTTEMRQRMSLAHAGQISWTKGKPLTDEHKYNLSLAHIGKNTGPRSIETRKRISKALKGKPKSKEARIRMSEASKGREPWNKGKIGIAGHKKSNEEKLKIAAANGRAIAMCEIETGEICKKFISVNSACKYLRENTDAITANRNTLNNLLNNNKTDKPLYGYLWKLI